VKYIGVLLAIVWCRTCPNAEVALSRDSPILSTKKEPTNFDTTTSALHAQCFFVPDLLYPSQYFKMQMAGWDGKERYDIVIPRLQADMDGYDEMCMVSWRYERAIPASGLQRVTKDAHPIYQRIGMLRDEWIPNVSQCSSALDWNKADTATLGIESTDQPCT
jgi:hypothetical protein